MKTLHITNCGHPESGGISTFYRELFRQAEREGRPIRLIVPGAGDRVEKWGHCGLLYVVRGAPSPFGQGYRLLMPGTYLLPGSPLRRIIAAERPHVIECCDKYTLNYLAGLLRVQLLGIRNYRPVVVGLTCERMDENVAEYISRHSRARALCRWYMRWLYFPVFDHHIAVSSHTAGELESVSYRHKKRRGVWIRPMGADCTLFHPGRRGSSFRSWLEWRTGAPEGAHLLLYAGRLAPEKNLELLIDALRILERSRSGAFHAVIAGDGPSRARMEHACTRDLPGGVCFLGHLQDRQMLANVYANCDALLHPNPHEPFGIAPLEAMASGLPLIAPDSGGITSYANERNALLVNPDADSFASAARRLGADRQLAKRLALAGRATAEDYDWPSVAASYFRLYEDLVAVACGHRTEPEMPPAFYSTHPSIRSI